MVHATKPDSKEPDQVTECILLEIRGVGGAPPEEILGGPTVQVAGDKLAGFHRADPLQDLSRHLPKADHVTVEAYEWGRLTSGTWSTALWWILLPFTLINVAGWTFRPLASEFEQDQSPLGPKGAPIRRGRSTLWWGRLLIMGGGMGLTALYAAWAAVLGADLIALTCGGDTECNTAWYMGPFRWFPTESTLEDGTTIIAGHTTWRLAAGMLLAALLMYALLSFIRRTQDHLEGFEPDPAYRAAGNRNDARLTRNTNLEDGGFWYRWGEYRRLFRWHLAMIVAVLAGISGYGYVRLGAGMPDPKWPVWSTAAIFLAMIFHLSGSERFEPNPTGAGSIKRLNQIGWTSVHAIVAIVSFLGSAWFTAEYGLVSSRLHLVTGIRWLSTLLWVTAVGLSVILVVRAGHARWSRSDRFVSETTSFGLPVSAAALAVYLSGVGWASVLHLLGRSLVGTDELERGGFETSLVDLFVLTLAGVMIIIATYRKVTGPNETAVGDVLKEYRAAGGPSSRVWKWAKGIANARRTVLLPLKTDWFLGLLVFSLIVIQFVQTYRFEGLEFRFWRWSVASFGIPVFGIEALRWVHPIASTAVVLYLFPGADIIRRMASSRDTRRQLGKIWDVLNFWPRRFHPFAAPCYAERAVPEFRERIKNHLLQDRAVVVSAHSQGTVIALAALLQIAGETQDRPPDSRPPAKTEGVLSADGDEATEPGGWYRTSSESKVDALADEREPLKRVALVTFGSPLSSLYGPFFPRYFGLANRFQTIRNQLFPMPGSGDNAWHNFYRLTDFIGRAVFIPPGGGLSPTPTCSPDIRVKEARRSLFRNEAHSNYEREPAVRIWILRLLHDLGGLTEEEYRTMRREIVRASRQTRPG